MASVVYNCWQKRCCYSELIDAGAQSDIRPSCELLNHAVWLASTGQKATDTFQCPCFQTEYVTPNARVRAHVRVRCGSPGRLLSSHSPSLFSLAGGLCHQKKGGNGEAELRTAN